ncbi:MAG TPA: hypothetical protein VGU20_08810 [Stellaceae bacterium]|nr:hypothetical protein [Stellaceae bacterium]
MSPEVDPVWKRLARQVEAFCARLTEGLIAVAVALAIVTTFTACEQHISALAAALQPIDRDIGTSILSQ